MFFKPHTINEYKKEEEERNTHQSYMMTMILEKIYNKKEFPII